MAMVAVVVGQAGMTSAFGIPEFLEFGSCAEAEVQEGLNLDKYSGIWFAQEMVPNEYTDIESCSMANYTYNGEIMTVVERGMTYDDRKARQNTIMRWAPDEGPRVMTVERDGVPSAPYKIVATDYENYSCAYSCMGFMGFRAAFSWIFTRKPDADKSYVALCRDLLASSGIDPTAMQAHKQGEGCPYMKKLDTLLAYNRKVMADSKAKEEATKPEKVLPEDASVNEIKTLIQNEEKHLQEIERMIEEEEKVLLRRIEEGKNELREEIELETKAEEDLINDLKKDVRAGHKKHNRGGYRRDHAEPTKEDMDNASARMLASPTTSLVTALILLAIARLL